MIPPTPLPWTLEVPITEQTQIGEARRVAHAKAQAAGFSPVDAGRLGIVTTELASNIVKHGVRGVILLTDSCGGGRGIDVLALDTGKGIASLQSALRDGFSTAGTPGTGLGAVQRQSDRFDVISTSSGTAVLARVVAGGAAAPPCDLAVLSSPHPAESRNGDAFSFRPTDSGAIFAVIDGLGHGDLASDAALAATNVFMTARETEPGALLQRIHDALRSSRGAAAAVARLDRSANQMIFAGVGNIAVSIINGASRRNGVSMYGIAGHEIRDIREFRYDCPAGAIVIMHTDGISTRWNIDPGTGLLNRDPALIAGVVWRDHRRHNDDATLLVTRM